MHNCIKFAGILLHVPRNQSGFSFSYETNKSFKKGGQSLHFEPFLEYNNEGMTDIEWQLAIISICNGFIVRGEEERCLILHPFNSSGWKFHTFTYKNGFLYILGRFKNFVVVVLGKEKNARTALKLLNINLLISICCFDKIFLIFY